MGKKNTKTRPVRTLPKTYIHQVLPSKTYRELMKLKKQLSRDS